MDEGGGYSLGIYIVGGLVGVMTFFGCWAYAVATYGWFLGLAFGWIPALIIAWMAGFLAGVLWPLVLLAVLGVVWLLFGR